jgi:glutathione S-transferase
MLDDGTVISVPMAISRFFEMLYPEPYLLGRDALEVAKIEMWNRRIEHGLYTYVQAVFRHTHPHMAEMEKPQIAAWAEANKPRVFEFLEVFDRELANRSFAALDRFTVADITGLVAVDFMKPAKLAIPDEFANVKRWHAETSARPSAGA